MSRILCLHCASIPQCSCLGWCKDQEDPGLPLRELGTLHGAGLPQQKYRVRSGEELHQAACDTGEQAGIARRGNMPGWSMTAWEHGAGAQRGRAHWVSVRTQTRPSSPNKQIPQMSLRVYTAGEFPKVERWSWGPDGGSQLSMQNVLTTTSLSSSRFLLMVVDFPSHLCTCTRTPPSRVMMLCRHGKRDCSMQMKAKNMIENMEPWLKGIFWGPYAKWQEYSPTRKRKKHEPEHVLSVFPPALKGHRLH